MARTHIEEANRVEIACDGCGRVFHQHEKLADDFKLNELEAPLLQKAGEMEYCPDCTKSHAERLAAEEEQRAAAAEELRLREMPSSGQPTS